MLTQRKKSASEAARSRERGGLVARRVGRALLVGLALAIAIVCGLQAQAVLRDRADAAAIDASRKSVAAGISRAIEASRTEVQRALDDASLRAALGTSDEASRAQARLRVRERLPGLAEIGFYGPDLFELLSVDLPSFGYARANALTQAKQRGASADVQYRADPAGGARLAFAEPIRDGERIVALVYLETRAPTLLEGITGPHVRGGTLTLTQGQRIADRTP